MAIESMHKHALQAEQFLFTDPQVHHKLKSSVLCAGADLAKGGPGGRPRPWALKKSTRNIGLYRSGVEGVVESRKMWLAENMRLWRKSELIK
jgi:hypothetical protein